MSKRLGGIIGCKDKTSASWHLIGFPNGSNMGHWVNTMMGCVTVVFFSCKDNTPNECVNHQQHFSVNRVVTQASRV